MKIISQGLGETSPTGVDSQGMVFVNQSAASKTERQSFFEKLVWTTKDVMQVLQCSERHVRELVASDKIPYAKVGRLVRFYRDQILEWVRKGGTQ